MNQSNNFYIRLYNDYIKQEHTIVKMYNLQAIEWEEFQHFE